MWDSFVDVVNLHQTNLHISFANSFEIISRIWIIVEIIREKFYVWYNCVGSPKLAMAKDNKFGKAYLKISKIMWYPIASRINVCFFIKLLNFGKCDCTCQSQSHRNCLTARFSTDFVFPPASQFIWIFHCLTHPNEPTKKLRKNRISC